MDPALWEILAGDDREEVEAIIRLKSPNVVPPGVELISRFANSATCIATCRLQRKNIRRVWADEAVASLKAPHRIIPEKEIVLPGRIELPDHVIFPSDIRRPPSLRPTGEGVVLGFIDHSFAFQRQIFRKPDGSTRLLALWDQSRRHEGLVPMPYGYGTLYLRPHINQALRSNNPYRALDYYPWKTGHGSHVADIAVGNGMEPNLPMGIAPEADIVFIDAASYPQGLANQGDWAGILDGIDLISRVAGNRPLVINISMGQTGGPPRLGCTLVEQAMDIFLNERTNRVICMSAGNYNQAQLHASGRLCNGETHNLTWLVEPNDRTPNELEIWYPESDVFSIVVQSPSGEDVINVPPGRCRSIKRVGLGLEGRAYHRLHDPNCPYHDFDLFLYPQAQPGSWKVFLTGERVHDGRYFAAIERDPYEQSHFDEQDADPFTTTNTICNGHLTIAVGAYDAHSPDREIAPFSSSCRTPDGRRKPDIVAPGMNVLAARCTADGHMPSSFGPNGTRKNGTSMAAPHVAGCAALMLEIAGRPLGIQEIRRLLFENVQPARVSGLEAQRMGRGYLNIEGAVAAAYKYGRMRYLPT